MNLFSSQNVLIIFLLLFFVDETSKRIEVHILNIMNKEMYKKTMLTFEYHKPMIVISIKEEKNGGIPKLDIKNINMIILLIKLILKILLK